MERCPDCGAEVKGALVCASCGAFEFEGLTSWVCFPCGAQNAHGTQRCGCGRERTLECGACGAEVPLAAERCPRCAVPRFAFAAAEEAQRRSREIQKMREGARTLAVGLAPLACAGLLLLLVSAHPSARFTGAW
ncbi:MAG: hypothetical protein HY901_10785, partial [Deltaproteobacteria bacterium]|nr:hypothetical protein [Deltaproteobacteria bacterium]